MVNYNEHKCLTCGQIFEYCRRCVVTPVIYKAEGFCSEECSDVFNILSKHSCNLATAEETLKALENYDTTNVTESIQAHIEKLKSEAQEVMEPKTTFNVEEVVKTTVAEAVNNNKNKKKKW